LILQGVSGGRRWTKALLIGLAFSFLILTLAEPKWGFQIQEVKRRGVDLVIALDLSNSMLAQDVKPSRLQRAKLEIESLLKVIKGDRVGLVAFAGVAFLQCPLTLDYATVRLFLDDLNVASLPRAGTDLGQALRKSVEAFEGQEGGERIVFLMTDGEDHGRSLEEALSEAKKKGIVLYPVGLGRPEGSPIPIVEEGEERRYLRDREGEIVLSKADGTVLERIAAATGGKAGQIGSGTFSLRDLYQREIVPREKRELDTQQTKNYFHRFQWPLAAAIFFLYLEGVLSERK